MHAWNVTPQEAIDIQRNLRTKIITQDDYSSVKFVAGVDIGFEANNTVTRAAVAVLSYAELQLIDYTVIRRPTTFPYVPGLLSFREVPAALEALEKLRIQPDILLVDGHGIAHPRRIGVASHLGLMTNMPSIGVAKKRLVGTHQEVPNVRGSFVSLFDKGEEIGVVLRSKVNVKPIFISNGHRISLSSAIEIAMHCVTRYRLPETTRWAHKLASGKDEVAQRLRMAVFS